MLGIQRDPGQLTDFVRPPARNPRRQRRVRFWLCSLLLCAPLYGIDRDRRLDQLDHTRWTHMEGAPGEVRALAQTTDRYLWLGTATGLFRFDGIRFEPYKPQSGQPFPQRSVASLFAVPDGGLWVSYWYGGASLIKDGTVTEYGKEEGLPSRPVFAFARDRKGAVWIAAGKDGLARLEGSRWRMIGPELGFAGPANTVFVDHTGTVWVGTPTSVVYLREGGSQFQMAAQSLAAVYNFAESPDGKLWIAETGYGVRAVPLPGKNHGRPSPAIFVGSLAITFDKQGCLWITSVGGGIRRVPDPEHLHQSQTKSPSAWQFHNSEIEAFTQKDGLTSDYIYSVLQDREGNVWIGTSGGLDRFRESPVVSVPLQPISYRGALPIPSLNSFTTSALAVGDQGALWAAGIGPQLLLEIQKDSIATQLRDHPAECAYRDSNGVVWFATPYSVFRLSNERFDAIGREQGAIAYNYDSVVPAGQGRTLRRYDLPTAGGITPNPRPRVKALTEDSLGRLWISMEAGTFRLERSGWTSLESLGGPQGTATAEFTDSQGRIWFGFANMVAILNGDRIRVFSGNDGVHVGAITSIQGKGAEIWIGGEFGLEVFDGSRFRGVNPSDGSALGGVSGLVAAPDDGLWFSENQGIRHIPEAQLRHLDSGKVEFETFGVLDGLTADLRGSLSSPSAVQTTDGRIWFATTRGVAWINPKRIIRNAVPPPVFIESVIANGRKYDISTFLKFPPRIANLQIGYTATSLTIPERVRFRYKLEGQDKEWQDAGTRREAFYTNLNPGSYQFRVIACNNDGVWNETGTLLHFDVLPALYQTATFRLAALVAGVMLLVALYQLRLRQAAARLSARLEERLAERERIARDLHDTLLQGFQGLILRFHDAMMEIPEREPARHLMETALDRADEVMAEGRDRVVSLHPSFDKYCDLAQSLARAGVEIANGSQVKVSVTTEGQVQTLDPVALDEIYCIGREAMVNAFRHAQGQRIEVEVDYASWELRLRIRDDGRGIDPKILEAGRPGHIGLASMRERAERVGGKLDIISGPGAGTEIELTVPAAKTYSGILVESPWRRLWHSTLGRL